MNELKIVGKEGNDFLVKILGRETSKIEDTYTEMLPTMKTSPE